VVEYGKEPKPQYNLILGNKTMKKLGIVLDFKSKTITIDEITLPMRNINLLKGAHQKQHHVPYSRAILMNGTFFADTSDCQYAMGFPVCI
jgi:hypothetical protein